MSGAVSRVTDGGDESWLRRRGWTCRGVVGRRAYLQPLGHGACIRMKARVAVWQASVIQSHRSSFRELRSNCLVDGEITFWWAFIRLGTLALL